MRRIFLAGLALAALSGQQPGLYESLAAAEPSAAPPAPPPPSAPPVAPVLSPFERAIGERIRSVAETLVVVEMHDKDGVVGHGSGVLVSPDGDVLTAAHVVKNRAQRFRVVLPDGESRWATVAGRDEARDAAVLHAPGKATGFAHLGPGTGALRAGDWVVCAGHGGEVASDRQPMRTVGLVVERSFAWELTEYTGNRRFPQPSKTTTFPGMLRLDCPTAPGMSGGPVVDLDGDVVGVVVGSPGVATPIEVFRRLLPGPARAASAASATAASSPPAAIPVIHGADGRPSRYDTLAPRFALPHAEASLVELQVGERSAGLVPAVLMSLEGLAVVSAARLRSTADPEVPVAASEITVVGHPDARCTEIVAVRGELALVRISGLFPATPEGGAEAGLRPVGPAGAAVVGELVAAVGPGTTPRGLGFVTGLDRRPGKIEPDGPRFGCGTMHLRFRQAHPPVLVGAALVHDASWPAFGSLLVDGSGRPVAMAVANRADGLGYAVPWTEVRERFAEWLR